MFEVGHLDADGNPVTTLLTEEQYRADENCGWTLRALKEALSREVDIVATEAPNIEKLFTLADQLPDSRKAYWLAEIAAAGIVKA